MAPSFDLLILNIKNVSTSLIEMGIDILKSISKSSVEKISSQLNEQPEQVYTAIENILSNDLLKSAIVSKNELEEFRTQLFSGTDPSEWTTKFYAEVWSGDMYGRSGIRGLEALYDDLRTRQSEISKKKEKIIYEKLTKAYPKALHQL